MQEISLPSIADAVSPSCPWGEVGAARQGDHGRAAVLGLALRAGLQLRLASLAVPTLLPELLLASGWAARAQLRGRWEAARGTAVGRRGGPCGRQQESCCCWWHSRQCPQQPPWGSQRSMGLRAFWKKGYTLQTDKCYVMARCSLDPLQEAITPELSHPMQALQVRRENTGYAAVLLPVPKEIWELHCYPCPHCHFHDFREGDYIWELVITWGEKKQSHLK